MKTIKISDRVIGETQQPFLIAEMSGNHNRSLDRALEIVDAAANAGAHAIKLQTYTPDTLTIDISEGDFLISDKSSPWYKRNLYDLYKEAYTPWEWHPAIFERAKERNIICISTPFDETSVDFLETLNVPAYKIASFENNYLQLLKKVARTGKPVIISTGLSTVSDIDLAVKTLKDHGCDDIILLKCTSTYPATPETSNLRTIPHMRDLFGCQIGLSDHTLGIGVAVAAIALGATVIEKHFTLDRSDGGVDSAFSLEPHEFKLLTEESEKAFYGLGNIRYGILEEEKKSMMFKRSIYIVEDMKVGDRFDSKNVRIIRPGLGVAPKFYEMILGKSVNTDVKKGTALSFDMIG